jgi:ATP-dependent Clp protease protease subunit
MTMQSSWPPPRPDRPPPHPSIPYPQAPPPPAPLPTSAAYGWSDPPDDLTTRLLDRRRVLVTGFLDDAVATRAAAALMWLDGTGGDAVELHLSCPDGDLGAAHALADTIDLVGVPVEAYARGGLGGPALGPFGAADRRRSSRLTVFRLQDPSVRFDGSARDLDGHVRHHRLLLDALHGRLAAATGQPIERVAADFARGTVLDAAEALDYGILHEVTGARPGAG